MKPFRILIALSLLSLTAGASAHLAAGGTDEPAYSCEQSGVTEGIDANGVRFGLSAIACEPILP